MTCNCKQWTLRTDDITTKYYFDEKDAVTDWDTSPENMIDGDTTNYALSFVSARTQYNTATTAPDNLDTTITKVEIRALTTASWFTLSSVTMYMYAVFAAGNGTTRSWTPPKNDFKEPAEFTEWYDITSDPNAPATWLWEDVATLGNVIWGVWGATGDPVNVMCSYIEVRVTWYDSVEMTYPSWKGIDGEVNANINVDNYWNDDLDAKFDGLNSEPLVLEGVDEACGDSLALCFPLCFPLCFYEYWQNKLEKINDWMDNHYPVRIDEFGDCENGIYVISDYSLDSVTILTYKYRLTLERKGDL